MVQRPEGGHIFRFIFSLKAAQVSNKGNEPVVPQDGQDVLFQSTTTGDTRTEGPRAHGPTDISYDFG